MNIEEIKKELIECGDYTEEELKKMEALEIVKAWQELPATI